MFSYFRKLNLTLVILISVFPIFLCAETGGALDKLELQQNERLQGQANELEKDAKVDPSGYVEKKEDSGLITETSVVVNPDEDLHPEPTPGLKTVETPELKKETDLGEKVEDAFIDSNVAISRLINKFAEGLDVWLAGKQYSDDKNETSAKLTGAVYHNTLDGTTTDVSFDFNLRLPHVEEYWMLTFTSYDDSLDNGVNDTYYRTSPRQRDYGASVGLMAAIGDIKTRFSPRISFDGFMQISNTLQFSTVVKGKGYDINPKLKFYAEPNVGTGTFLSLNVLLPINTIFNVTVVNEGEYIERERKFLMTNGFSLGQWFSDRSSISYNAFANSHNRPSMHLTSYSLSISWSQIIYKNILDYQLMPNINFSKENAFEANPGVNLVVGIKF